MTCRGGACVSRCFRPSLLRGVWRVDAHRVGVPSTRFKDRRRFADAVREIREAISEPARAQPCPPANVSSKPFGSAQ